MEEGLYKLQRLEEEAEAGRESKEIIVDLYSQYHLHKAVS